ncbi:MAG: lysylphosphatidylglycerol synthase transmembrane domain-containing protein [Syntrophales bacterium]|jgi:uncharacterized protein (TIRG00374 family)|nr:lysylphosphatidylglycerol synthase transmembrane domain-containing protein [Syntrophales bacterium]
MKKILLGVILGALLSYLSMRGIQFDSVAATIRRIQPLHVFSSLLLMFLMQVIRAVRWGLILRPVVRVDPFTLFSVTNVGFLAIVAFPARLGELVRPLLISRKKAVPMTSALGTVFVERIMDLVTVLLIVAFLLPLIPLPPWLIRSLAIMSLTSLGATVFLVSMTLRRKNLEGLWGFLPASLRGTFTGKLGRLAAQFMDGFAVIRNAGQMVRLMILSLGVWFANAGAIYALFLAFGYSLSLLTAFILMFVLIVGIAIPTAPGFVGNWHYACVLALTSFGLDKTDALAFAVFYHALSIGLVLILGLLFLPFNRFTLRELRNGRA